MPRREGAISIGTNVKQLGNIKKKTIMKKLILKDLLGEDANALIGKLKKSHLKTAKKEKLIINDVYRSVTYFNEVFDKRRALLKKNITHSKDKTYAKPTYWYRDEVRQIVADKRLGKITSY